MSGELHLLLCTSTRKKSTRCEFDNLFEWPSQGAIRKILKDRSGSPDWNYYLDCGRLTKGKAIGQGRFGPLAAEKRRNQAGFDVEFLADPSDRDIFDALQCNLVRALRKLVARCPTSTKQAFCELVSKRVGRYCAAGTDVVEFIKTWADRLDPDELRTLIDWAREEYRSGRDCGSRTRTQIRRRSPHRVTLGYTAPERAKQVER